MNIIKLFCSCTF